MPVAEPFSFKGLGNGFPMVCLSSVDVLEEDWFLYAPLTIDQVFALYYNLAEAKGTATLNREDPPLALSVEDSGLILDPTSTEDPKEELLPHKRVCGVDGSEVKVDSGDQFFYRVSVEVKLPRVFFKMYEGPTDNEANFIGYGFEGEVAAATANEDGGSGRVGTNDILANYCLYDPATTDVQEQLWFQQFSILRTLNLTVSEKTVSGIPFILFRYDAPLGVTATADITALEFYTYP